MRARRRLDDLDKSPRTKVIAVTALLAERGPTLPFPFSSQVRGKIAEARMKKYL